MGNLAIDTTNTGGRGAPNAWSPGSGPVASGGLNWVQQRGDQTLGYNGSQLQLTYNLLNVFGIMTYTTQTASTAEISVVIQPGNLSCIMGAVLCFVDTSHFYYVDINSGTTFEIGMDNGGFSTLASTGFVYLALTSYNLKFRKVGTSLKAKIWRVGTAEPDWMLSLTDATFSSGLFGVGSQPIALATSSWSTFSVNDTISGQTLLTNRRGIGKQG